MVVLLETSTGYPGSGDRVSEIPSPLVLGPVGHCGVGFTSGAVTVGVQKSIRFERGREGSVPGGKWVGLKVTDYPAVSGGFGETGSQECIVPGPQGLDDVPFFVGFGAL